MTKNSNYYRTIDPSCNRLKVKGQRFGKETVFKFKLVPFSSWAFLLLVVRVAFAC